MFSVHFHFLISLVGTWNPILVHSRPQDLFYPASINEPIGPIGDDVDLFLLDGLNDDPFYNNNINPTDFAINSELTTNKQDPDASLFHVNDLFPAEESSFEITPLLQSSPGCETDDSLAWTDDHIPSLQTRGDSSCPSSKPKEPMDAIVNFFQNPENWLRGNMRSKKPPTGQGDQPGPNDDDLGFGAFLQSRPVPMFFEEMEQTCPSKIFGISTTPACFNAMRGFLIRYPGNTVTLRPVSPCMLPFFPALIAELPHTYTEEVRWWSVK